MRTEQLRREFELPVRHTVFPLHPEIPEAGMPLTELFAGRLDVDAMLARLRKVAADLELPFGDRTHTYNSRRAQELGKWAEDQQRGEAFHNGVYRAYFVAGRNIARPDVLVAIAGEAGLDTVAARQVLDEGRFAAAVDADWQRTRDMGISAVPTLQHGRCRLVGFHPYAEYRELVAGQSG